MDTFGDIQALLLDPTDSSLVFGSAECGQEERTLISIPVDAEAHNDAYMISLCVI
ncbi:hypothetical protein P691DRAFT_812720, partial [Macrolepiota fuliginosa MF-IS2]